MIEEIKEKQLALVVTESAFFDKGVLLEINTTRENEHKDSYFAKDVTKSGNTDFVIMKSRLKMINKEDNLDYIGYFL